jgi:hypothetical protein
VEIHKLWSRPPSHDQSQIELSSTWIPPFPHSSCFIVTPNIFCNLFPNLHSPSVYISPYLYNLIRQVVDQFQAIRSGSNDLFFHKPGDSNRSLQPGNGTPRLAIRICYNGRFNGTPRLAIRICYNAARQHHLSIHGTPNCHFSRHHTCNLMVRFLFPVFALGSSFSTCILHPSELSLCQFSSSHVQLFPHFLCQLSSPHVQLFHAS